MAYPAGYWAELVRSNSSTVLNEDVTGNFLWLRTSDGEPLEQQYFFSGQWNAVVALEEPDYLGHIGTTVTGWRARKSGENWLPSASGMRWTGGQAGWITSISWGGATTHRFFEVPNPLAAPSFDDATGDAITGTVGTAINAVTVPAANGNPAPTYAVVGTLPAGLSFDATTRVLSGNPTAAASGTITIRATNSQGNADWTVDYSFNQGPVVLAIGSERVGGLVIVNSRGVGEKVGGIAYGANVVARFDSAPPVASPTHTATIGVGTGGYNGVLGVGSIDSPTYDTPGGKSVTIVHCRAVGAGINFALSGAAAGALADFPTRIVVTKTTGGRVERTFVPRTGTTPRSIPGAIRLDYDPTSGAVGDVFVNDQTIEVQLFY